MTGKQKVLTLIGCVVGGWLFFGLIGLAIYVLAK